jgi:hypothetical protein
VAEGPPRKATILLPPLDHPQCVTRLLAWICHPDPHAHKQRERVDQVLLAWWWRNCQGAGVVALRDVPPWVKEFRQRALSAGFDRFRGGIKKASDSAWAWQIARNSQLGVNDRDVGLYEVFEARNPDHFAERTWSKCRPLIHVTEHVLDHLSHLTWQWETQRRADLPQERALLDLISLPNWVTGQLAAAEELRLGWNANLGKHVGLDPAKTFQVALAENVQILGGQGDYFPA